jgi:hypothetical protein
VLYRVFASGRPRRRRRRARTRSRSDRQREHVAAVRAVSGALTPVNSATAAQWRCFGFVYIRGGDTTGTAVGSFEFNHSGTTGGGGPVSATGNAIFGGVSRRSTSR